MTFDPRRARPGDTFTYTNPVDGRQVDLRADDEGVVEPRSPQEKELLDGFDLPVARKVQAERKAAEQKEGES